MRILVLLMLGLFFAGCCMAPEEPYEMDYTYTVQDDDTDDVVLPVADDAEDDEPVSDANGTIIEVTPQPEEDEEYETSVATDQAECSTMSPNCEACLAKEGCNWCKTTNGCYYEDEKDTIGCNPGDWAETVEQCVGVPGGGTCSEQTNCAACLSGSGCKWCIQGSVCADESSTDDCLNNGWLTESYECALASR